RVLVDRGALQDDQTAHVHLGLGSQAGGCGLLRAEHEALLRQAQVTARGAHDAPDEEIEKDEEASLQEQQHALDIDRGADHETDLWKTRSVDPTVMRSSFSSCARFWRRPLTVSPFV